MVAGLSESATFEHLSFARMKLANILPPQADKIVRALQHVDLALQHYTIDGVSNQVLHATRVALRALNQLEKQQDLPPQVRLAVSQSTSELASIIKAIRATESSRTSDSGLNDADVIDNGHPNRRVAPCGDQAYTGLRRRSDDDTVDGLECLTEELMLLSRD